MSTSEEKVKEITEFFVKQPHLLKILLAEDNSFFQATVINKIGEAIKKNIASILDKRKISFVGTLIESEEKQGKDLILTYRDNEKTVLIVEIRLAIDGEETVEFFKQHNEQGKPFNYVLMNHQMPKRLGSEAIKDIRAYEKEKKKALERCVIIGWTSNDDFKELMITEGANKFYRKSISYETIKELVLQGIFDFPKVTETYDTEQREGPTP